MKTCAEFVEEYRHGLAGMVLDALTINHEEHSKPLSGAALSQFARKILRKVDAELVKIYGALVPAEPIKPLANGATQTRKAGTP